MAKQKFRPTRLGGFSGAKAYIVYVEVLKKCRNAVGRTFCDAIKLGQQSGLFTEGPVGWDNRRIFEKKSTCRIIRWP
jgi:hypothetical protein